MIKLLMSWDIKEGRDAEYFEFVVREWAPGITKMGIQPTEAWYTMYGDCQQILTGGITDDIETMHAILQSEEWERLHEKLLDYVDGYQQKIVPATGTIQIF
nr:hypothetical protein [Anaerolineae bacterium]